MEVRGEIQVRKHCSAFKDVVPAPQPSAVRAVDRTEGNVRCKGYTDAFPATFLHACSSSLSRNSYRDRNVLKETKTEQADLRMKRSGRSLK